MPELSTPPRPPANIECYGAQFPPGQPGSIAAFAEVVGPAFDFAIPDFAADQPFSASAEVYFLPDVTLSRARSTASRLTRTARTIAVQGTDQILAISYLSGHFDLTIAGERRRVQAGEIAFIDMSREAVIEAPAVDNIGLAMSRQRIERLVDVLDRAHGFIRPDDALARIMRTTMLEVAAEGPGLGLVDARGVADAIFDLAAACLAPLSRPMTESGRNTASLVAIKAHIEEHLLDPGLGPQSLAAAFGITRSTLYRLFEPLGGVSGFIARRRLNHAFRRLSDTRTARERISTLAASLGYRHASAFTRAFKQAFGLSPKEVQTLAEHTRHQDVPLMPSPEPLQYFHPLSPSR